MDSAGEKFREPDSLRRMLARATALLTPLAVLAGVLALLVPSGPLAAHGDWLLAALVLLTALGIEARRLASLRDHLAALAVLSVAPLLILAVVSWGLGQAFGADVRHGLLGIGLASSEVASVGLVALAGADVTVAVGVVAGSLVASAILGPLLIGLLAGHGAHHVNAVALLGRFGLVVILPLVAGVAIRSAAPVLARWDADRDGLASLVVAGLVYASLSGTAHARGLGSGTLAAAAFLVLSALVAAGWRHAGTRIPGIFTVTMRDFAVAATLATQAFGPRAGAVPGVYGVLMLVAASVAATRLRRAGSRAA